MTPNKSIPFVDLSEQMSHLKDDIVGAITGVIDSNGYILGKEVELFEEEFAEYCGASFGVGVANGTEALHMALRACEIGIGDEVITAGNSFVATMLAIAYSGASPVLVDINSDDYTLDTRLLEQAITPRTKAIIPVHLYGQPAQMTAIREIADRHGLYVIEDSAQAHGAEYHGKRAGSLGHVGCFSFYPSKNLGAMGDGGAVVTSDPAIFDRLQLLRNYGQRKKNEYAVRGYNCRLDTMQAAVLLTKLPHLDRWTEQRRDIASWYREFLSDSSVVLPSERAEVKHVYHLYVVRIPERDRIMKELMQRGIGCGVHYPDPLHHIASFENVHTVPSNLPVSSTLASEILSLPMYPGLLRSDVERVANELLSLLSVANVV